MTEFTVTTGGPETGRKKQDLVHHFVTDGDGIPKKLGDGTFGAVFEVEGDFAIKILYSSVNKLGRARFHYETQVLPKIKQKLKEDGDDQFVDSIVNCEGATKNFHESPAFTQLEPVFKSMGLSLSNLAMLMPRYHGTLKDLLEKLF